ncbi:MAG: acyl CoA--acetate/3-ketoacid CoA transferase subunit alpha [Acidimicrobiia bacterium]|nr:acyl CoA--acetate/3-ketoacid CoA transferase subunit alpha [Acidimicrobiia bacterium]
MADKTVSAGDAAAAVRSGMTVGIGGWGSRRKPMELVRALLRTDVDDLTVVSWGGPDLGLLCATKKASTVHYPFCTLDSIPLEPHFRKARQDAAVSAIEWDEGMFYWGLTAGSMRLPFLPSRAGLGSDVFRSDPRLRTVASPYTDEDLVAVPPLRFDVAFVHVNRADAAGNGQILGADPYFDDLFCKCADAVYMSAEAVVPTAALLDAGPLPTLRINRMAVTGVVEAPGGAGFTECPPDYGRDEAAQKEYAATARDPDAFDAWLAAWLDQDGAR